MGRAGTADELSNQMLSALQEDLQASLASAGEHLGPAISEMIAYHLGWSDPEQISGKRIRPLLTLLCCQAAGGDWRSALPAASAIEWVHNFSLIHDDIQDRSELRRGRPSVWKVWGSAQAINTGDAVFALSHLSALRMLDHGIPARKILMVDQILNETSLALTRGQNLDIAFESAEQVQTEIYMSMIGGKTAALIGAACQIGALLSPADQDRVGAFKRFGENLGLAFQVIDDLLGVWGESESTGKSSADDLRTKKKTLPIIHGLQNSPEFRRAWASVPLTDDVIERMKQLLEETGSRDYTAEWAKRYTDNATSALQSANPRDPAGSQLASLAARLLQRVA
ncbi:MAG: polyprenyl synthetase family protein [Anaerolineales bacterium]|nr:polyprenyl synthetase family protein [Anaerolineales bacterium]